MTPPTGRARRLLGTVTRGMLGAGVAGALVACSGDPFQPLPAPEGAPVPTTSTSAPPNFRGVALAPVPGVTTTSEVVVGPGRSTLAGRVEGPEGPVEGAVVNLERLVGDASASLQVTTGAGGGWQAPEVLGGRYRIRAWRSPDLAMLEPQILFVEAERRADLVLVMERFRASAVDTAVAPNPPVVGGRTNVLVRVSSQVVDEDGVVRATPQAGTVVNMATGAGWQAQSPPELSTDGNGTATFTLICRSPGAHPLMVTLVPTPPASPSLPGSPATPPGDPAVPDTTVPSAPAEVFTIEPPGCRAPPPPTVLAPAEPGSTTTTE